MKTWIASWKPYFSLYRLKAMQETQYRAAALGGLVTQAFFGLLYVFLYTALFRGENQAELAETITYVWLQQMFFRVLLMNDTELIQQVMTGGLAYAVLRPVDQYRFAFVRNMAQRHVNALMRLVPMIALQFLLPTAWRMQPPESLLALMQAFVSLLIGVMNLCAIAGISGAILMQTMDNRGINAIITFISNAFAGNIIPLTLFPDSVQAIIRYQPFAQSLDAPIRMYLHAQAAGEGAEHRRAAALADAAGCPWAQNVAASAEQAHDSGRVKRDEVCVSCPADAVAVRDAVPRVVLDADAGAAGDVRQ